MNRCARIGAALGLVAMLILVGCEGESETDKEAREAAEELTKTSSPPGPQPRPPQPPPRPPQPPRPSGPPKELTLDLGGGVTMKLVLIPAGTFTMGSPSTEAKRDPKEGPQRKVTLTKPFYMGVTEVTQGQWRQVTGTTPWKGKEHVKDAADCPAVYVSWKDARGFCTKLCGKTGRAARLPTEAEWEYACRAGTTTRFSYGDDPEYSRVGEYAWYAGNSPASPHRVGAKKPNAWGVHDMHGNVSEWCADFSDVDYYGKGENTDPQGPASGVHRVLRGGAWSSNAWNCRSAYRWSAQPGSADYNHGFRVVVTAQGP